MLQYVYNMFHPVLGHQSVMFVYSASVRLIIEVDKRSAKTMLEFSNNVLG